MTYVCKISPDVNIAWIFTKVNVKDMSLHNWVKHKCKHFLHPLLYSSKKFVLILKREST